MDYKTLGKDPIAGDSPVGINARYEERFETLQAEIDKLANPLGRDSFQWEIVAKNASLVLAEESKDLLVASYLCVALVNLQGANGLDTATQIYKDLISTYWTDMFPPAKRLRGRIAAVEWWIDRTVKALESAEPGSITEELNTSIKERFNAIDELLGGYLGDKVFLRPLIRAVDEYLSRGIVPDPREEAASEPQTPEASVAPQASPPPVAANASQLVDLLAPSVSLDSPDQVHKQLKPVFQKIAQGSKLLREAAISDPQSYQWLRFAAYSGLKVLPPADGAGKTSISAPPPQLVSRLKSLHRTGSWIELLNTAETNLMNIQYVFWLDLNRYAALALQNLDGCHEALDSVEQGVQQLLNRLPGLVDLKFSSDQPFADEDTQEWLASISEQSSGNPSESGTAVQSAASVDEAFSEAIEEARSIAEDPKRIGGALRVLETQIAGCSSEKDVLELRLIMLELLSKTRQPEPAAALAELVLADVERFQLREWDVSLAVRCHLQVYDVFKKASGKAYKERQREVYQRILSMSAAEALSL